MSTTLTNFSVEFYNQNLTTSNGIRTAVPCKRITLSIGKCIGHRSDQQNGAE